RQTTLNFAELMEKRQIVCVRLSLRLPSDVKTFIGTILINELMQAVQHRADLPPEKRHQFSLFVDEFQTFAGYQDFAVLFTQARKLGIATTVAHQERYGQFGENKAILGATDAAGNKIFFQLTVRDATEQAQEFAKPPPMEKRREALVSLVNTPFDFLILGHYNEEIRRFARKYLLPLKYRQDDLEAMRALMEIEESVHLKLAEIHRLNAQIDALYEGKGKAREQQLMEAKAELLHAKRLTEAMKDWWHQRRVTTETIRYLNSIIVAIEEGDLKPWPGNERFCEFLIDCARHSSFVPWQYVEVLTLYLSLVYGDPARERAVPVAFATRQGVFPEEITQLIHEAEEKTRRVREHVWQGYVSCGLAGVLESLAYQARERQREQAIRLPLVTQQLAAVDIRDQKRYWYAPSVYLTYLWLLAFPDLGAFLAPYRTSRFDRFWRALVIPDLYSIPYCQRRRKREPLGRSKREPAADVQRGRSAALAW
ncbi:MAG TPA: type IV secretory system conjugative DNA transfer family protein, partial [Desulfatiglandales bacterium]|nr:type IV secretory system conjugative DNA transfer family protein [Desulfatiglandales bacterium]